MFIQSERTLPLISSSLCITPSPHYSLFFSRHEGRNTVFWWDPARQTSKRDDDIRSDEGLDRGGGGCGGGGDGGKEGEADLNDSGGGQVT